jgi:SWI/SNF-related matrix-associated actin-dependent regulator of chromatin subfamily A3
LYDYQQKGLSFLLQREQDWSTFKKCRKEAERELLKEKGKSKTEKARDDDAEDKKEQAKVMKPSIWEPQEDGKGRIKSWKNRMTDEVVRGKKGDRPFEGKGAILADDVSIARRYVYV